MCACFGPSVRGCHCVDACMSRMAQALFVCMVVKDKAEHKYTV